ncbi:hypothetical protein Slin15195_G116280 [Septoria linicola]|uniref:Uncharacterized protein n=1 Tax=Septoria linicola TaxID=215465 RepID=A0A9Q9AZM6_9PEZI|nr:hypothetical protein Slin15195_G116280 [Septoria linicola]
MDPDMDPETAAMLADLSVVRFDQIAAPEARGKGPHVSEYDRAQVVDEQDLRRKRIFDGPVENERHAAIQQWNTPSTFGVDDRAAGLEDRWGGQGHRAGMRVTLLEKGRGFQGNPNHHDHGPRRDRHNDRSQQIQQERATRAAPDPNRKRASSPRKAGGTTRFINGKPITQPARATIARGNATANNAGLSSAAAARVTQNLRKIGLLPTSPSPVPSRAPAPARPAAPVTRVTATKSVARAPDIGHEAGVTKSIPSPRTSACAATNDSHARAIRAPSVSSVGTASSSVAAADPGGAAFFQNLASRIMGRKTAPAAATTSSNVPPAVPTPAPNVAPIATAPLLAGFQSGARLPALTTAIVGSSTATAVPAPRPATTAPQLTTAAPINRSTKVPTEAPRIYDENDKAREQATTMMSPQKILAINAAETRGHSGQGIDSQLLRISRQKIAEDVVRLAQKQQSEEAQEYFSTYKSRTWLLQPAVDALAGKGLSADLQADFTVQAVVRQALLIRAKAGSLPSPPGSAERPRSKSTALRSLEALPAQEKTARGGLLNVDYYDDEGNHRGNHLMPVLPPLRVNVTVTAKNGEFDPLKMADQMEALAERLMRNM